MKRLYAEGAFQLLPAGNGFVFSAKQSTHEDKIVVSYKMFSLGSGIIAPITRSVFLHTKFGEGYRKFEKSKKDFLTCRTVFLPENRLLVIFPNGAAAIFQEDNVVWQGDILHREEGPSDVAFSGNALWFSFPQSGAIIKYNLRNMREELRIGGGKVAAFVNPQALWYENDMLMLCNTGANKISEINLRSYTVSDYAEFEEPVLQYLKLGGTEIVLLESGIYKL